MRSRTEVRTPRLPGLGFTVHVDGEHVGWVDSGTQEGYSVEAFVASVGLPHLPDRATYVDRVVMAEDLERRIDEAAVR